VIPTQYFEIIAVSPIKQIPIWGSKGCTLLTVGTVI